MYMYCVLVFMNNCVIIYSLYVPSYLDQIVIMNNSQRIVELRFVFIGICTGTYIIIKLIIRTIKIVDSIF